MGFLGDAKVSLVHFRFHAAHDGVHKLVHTVLSEGSFDLRLYIRERRRLLFYQLVDVCARRFHHYRGKFLRLQLKQLLLGRRNGIVTPVGDAGRRGRSFESRSRVDLLLQFIEVATGDELRAEFCRLRLVIRDPCEVLETLLVPLAFASPPGRADYEE